MVGGGSGEVIRVLHVDDETSLHYLIKGYAETFDPGLEIEATDRIDDVFVHIGRGDIDCILSDYRMPGTNGVELARRVREVTDLPFILYTGQGSEEVAETAFNVGVDDYIRKEPVPSHYQVLFKRIRSAVEKHRAEAKLRESLLTSASIFEAIPSGLLIYRFEPPDRLYLEDGNPAAEKLGGLAVDEWRGKDFSEVWPYDREVGLKERYIKLIKKGKTLFQDKIYWNDSRVEGYFNVRAFPIPGNRLAVAFDNISDTVRYEEKLLGLHRHALGLNDLSTEEEIREWTMDVLESLGYDYISYLENVGDHLISRSSRGRHSLRRPLPLDGRGITVRAANERRSFLVNDLRGNKDYVTGPVKSLSELAVPVIVGRETIAVINIESQAIDAYAEGDQRVLETLAMHVASATLRLRGEAAVEAAQNEIVRLTQ